MPVALGKLLNISCFDNISFKVIFVLEVLCTEFLSVFLVLVKFYNIQTTINAF